MSAATTFRTWVILALLPPLLAACQTTGTDHQNAIVGAGLGAAVGGLGCAALGGKPGACLALAGAGAIIGGAIGAQIDERDRARRQAALEQARRSSGTVSWKNPQTGNSGTITPLRAVNQGGRQCRVVKELYFKNGEPISGETTVCG
ncbi:RT0821/Lpp0805 family surface protein [Ancylobacter mangrovi]|uniref:RT0821/Lpp0805 family surface protein n=1 Tax=Ancylobacter mangrovi TaxID=2972472 RepID=A0A9X2PI52_9HYPH|nr:RT0821/Lpp0805 family surface protein [Ancylobacter mangrovi]MCS0494803.1 RT0821/Lpp0805 family surface protein [Ancylobacter mangrovi]MCS0502194.1 RT0821/Lpp0805 family surface protein [Ancylobacter mangrovi]